MSAVVSKNPSNFMRPAAASAFFAALVLAGCGGGAGGDAAQGNAAVAAGEAGAGAGGAESVLVSMEVAEARDVLQAVATAVPAAPAAPVAWVKAVDAGQSFILTERQVVRFGSGANWVVKMASGTQVCDDATFPGPVFAGPRQCQVLAPLVTVGWPMVASEGQKFTLVEPMIVRYGLGSTWVERTLSGTVNCNSTTFTDPAPGVTKRCVVWIGSTPPRPLPGAAPTGLLDARRLADQATFGANETLLAQMQTQSASAWVKAQMLMPRASRYTSGNGDAVDKNVQEIFFCERAPYKGDNCWRDWFSSEPLLWDFYRNATTQPDQLRQRVAFALSQIVVISALETEGTYGLRGYHNMLLDMSFANYRELLKKVSLSPMMGEYLNHVNNDRAAPNENYPRELLQLFAIGTCELNLDGSLKTGICVPTYNNATVREYAYALTGWTYPAGGSAVWGCWPEGSNCTYRAGDMVPVARYHDNQERRLLGGVTLPAARSAPQALERVLDSLMAHPNIAPFIGRQLVQHLVTSNPTPAFVQRVAQAFNAGRYVDPASGSAFGAGIKGDLAATVAAVLLDAEARSVRPGPDAGKLRDPVLTMIGVLRGLNGRTDGAALGWWWGETFRQHAFRSPSVFNFYSPSYPLAGTNLVAPAFGIHNANSALNRLNYLTYLLDWGGSSAESGVPNAIGTQVDLSAFVADAADAPRLVDRIARLALGEPLPAAARTQVLNAVQAWTAQTDSNNWQRRRVQTAAYLIYGSPMYQVQR